MAQTSTGAPATPSTQVSVSAQASTVAIWFTISWVAASPSFSRTAGQHRHKRLAERTLGEQAAQQIGNAEGDVERVGERAGAKSGGHEQLAHQPGDARCQRQQRDQGGGFEQ